MLLQLYSYGIMCKAFLATLKGLAWKWFINLQSNNINFFSKLSQSFSSHFIGGRHYRRLATYLLNIKQVNEELLRDYASKFN